MSDRNAHPLPFGAELQPGGSARFRLWAPSAAGMTLEVEGKPVPMRAEGGGWFSAEAQAAPGARYRFRMPDGLGVPDPAARVQAGDVHDESALVDPAAYAWRNTDWRGRIETWPNAAGAQPRKPALLRCSKCISGADLLWAG